MSEVCEICGLEIRPYADEWSLACTPADVASHWRRGYEREKARAEEAERRARELEAACDVWEETLATRTQQLAAAEQRASEARALALREAAEIVKLALDAGRDPNHLDVLLRERADECALGTNPPADWAPLPGVTEAMAELRAELARCSDQPAHSSISSDRDATGGAE